jgi:hypothetical protein
MRTKNLMAVFVFVLTMWTAFPVKAWYSPSTQRWINRDPIEEHGGINLYTYVVNSPTSNLDPSGLDILPVNTNPDPFCAADCAKQHDDCLNRNMMLCGLAGAAAGAGGQAINTSATSPGKGRLLGGGPSGDYTSYSRRWLGRPVGRAIGRTPIGVAGVLGALAADLGAVAYCAVQYGNCVDNCPRASAHPPFPLNVVKNGPPPIIIR